MLVLSPVLEGDAGFVLLRTACLELNLIRLQRILQVVPGTRLKKNSYKNLPTSSPKALKWGMMAYNLEVNILVLVKSLSEAASDHTE